MSALKTSGYGDGRTGPGRMGPGGGWMGAEGNGATPSGIPLPGITAGVVIVPLAGQPPTARHGNWGDLTWVRMPKAGEGL